MLELVDEVLFLVPLIDQSIAGPYKSPYKNMGNQIAHHGQSNRENKPLTGVKCALDDGPRETIWIVTENQPRERQTA